MGYTAVAGTTHHDEDVRAASADVERFSSQYNFVRARQLEGSYPGEAKTGAWLVTTERVACGWGHVLEQDWPRTMSRDAWPPFEPPGLDEKAKTRRLQYYQRVRSPFEACILVAHLMRVQAAVEVTAQWFDARAGVIELPAAGEPIVGTHCVSLVGFDLVRSNFVFLNSWGPQWGSRGLGWLPFEYFERYLVSAWAAPLNAGPLPAWFAKKGVIQVAWGMHDWLGHPVHGGAAVHGREVYDGTHDERMGWTFAVHRDGFLDVEEFFVRPQYQRQRVGTQLVEMLRALAAELKRPLRLWVPFADWTASNIPLVERIARKLGLKMFHANVRWAAAMALDPSALPPAPKEEGLQNEL